MANIKKIKLDNTIYDLYDANAVHSVNGQAPDESGNVSVSAELPDGLVKYNSLSTVEAVTPLNADTLETHPASYFATASDVSALQSGKISKSGDTMTGKLIAQNNTNYSVAQVRNIIISTSDPSGGNSGDIWIKYVE